jgi:demethylmenaquinone methyltransferase / 2-methoxy-6-polyprenyl-1,4-benzoquinol methylase
MTAPATQPPAASPAGAALVAPGSGAMFDKIARRYDLLNRVMSFGVDRRWRKRTVKSLALGDRAARVLDVATGTGDLAIDIARRHPRATVVGVDPSSQMIAVGDRKVTRFDGRVTLTLGDAQRLAFDDASFDAVTIAFGIRNVPDRARGLREMARVCKPGGRVAILELGEPRRGVIAPLARFHIRHVVPRLGALLSGAREYRYLQSSIAAFPPPDEFAAMMTAAGLAVLEVVPLTFGVCTLYVGTPAPRPGSGSVTDSGPDSEVQS